MLRRRIGLLALGCFVWGGCVGLRLTDLQVVRSGQMRALARTQQEQVISLDARRGLLYDRHGRELAMSVEVDSVYAVPGEIVDPVRTAATLAPTLGIERSAIPSLVEKLNGDKKYAIGASAQSLTGGATNYHASSFGAPNVWKADGGKFVHMWETSEFKAGLEVMIKMAAAGLYSVAVGDGTGTAMAFETRLLLAQMLADGKLAPEDADAFPHKNVCLGPFLAISQAEPLAISHHRLAPGQCLLVAMHQVATALNVREQAAWVDASAPELQELGVQLGARAHSLLMLRCR